MAAAPTIKHQQSRPGFDVAPIKDAIVFLSRANIRPIIRQELKTAGIQNLHNSETLENCVENLKMYPRALLILDFDHGSEIINSMLRAAQSTNKADTRPIFLLASAISSSLVAIGAEYYVGRILTGEISRSALHEHLEAIMIDEMDALQLRPHLNRIASARMRQDYDTVVQLLRDLTKRDPDDPRLTCELADGLIQKGDWAEARTVLDQLGGAKSHLLRAKHLYARCLMREGQHEDAIPILENTRLINPHNVERLIDLGVALMNCDRLKEANAAFDSAMTLDRDEPEAIKGKAQCRLMEGDINEALMLIRQVSGPRELASIFNNAAILSIRADRFDSGFDLYHSALRALGASEPAAASVLFNLGIAYYKRNQASEALSCFEKAFGMDNKLEKARHNALVLAAKLERTANFAAPEKNAEGSAKDFTEFDDETLS
jgi:Flp pilus assembly protein TadD